MKINQIRTNKTKYITNNSVTHPNKKRSCTRTDVTNKLQIYYSHDVTSSLGDGWLNFEDVTLANPSLETFSTSFTE